MYHLTLRCSFGRVYKWPHKLETFITLMAITRMIKRMMTMLKSWWWGTQCFYRIPTHWQFIQDTWIKLMLYTRICSREARVYFNADFGDCDMWRWCAGVIFVCFVALLWDKDHTARQWQTAWEEAGPNSSFGRTGTSQIKCFSQRADDNVIHMWINTRCCVYLTLYFQGDD